MKARCSLLRASAYVVPKTLLASCVRKSTVRSRAEFIIGALRLRENVLHERTMTICRNAGLPQNHTHDPLVSHLGIFETQGMTRQSGHAQELAQPLPVP